MDRKSLATLAMLDAVMEVPFYARREDCVQYDGGPRTKAPARRLCLLPGCLVITTHRGGYCCPEHCRMHKKGLIE